MKKILFTFFLSLAFLGAFGQVTETDSLNTEMNTDMYDFYMKKRKKQKKTSLILLGSGVLAFGTGVILAHEDGPFGTKGTVGSLLILSGSLATIASLPVGIASYNNLKKAEGYIEVGSFRPMETAGYNSEGIAVGLKIKF